MTDDSGDSTAFRSAEKKSTGTATVRAPSREYVEVNGVLAWVRDDLVGRRDDMRETYGGAVRQAGQESAA